MKKHLYALLLLSIAGVFASGCLDNGPARTGGNDLSEGYAYKSEVDVDLTALSSTMVYAEVYNIMTNPDDYFGKTIKVSGPYAALYYDKTGLFYHYVVIEDATLCCQNGLEFIWNGEHAFPDDYPDERTQIEITGMFGSYKEFGQDCYYLDVDDILIKE